MAAMMNATPAGRLSFAPLPDDTTVTVGGLLRSFDCFVVERGEYWTPPTQEERG